jgi:glutamyl/glutaminyl-tRNA synthetase
VKLDWLNQQHIMQLSVPAFTKILRHSVIAAGMMTDNDIQKNHAWFTRVSELLQPRLKRFSDVSEIGPYFFTDDFRYDDKVLKKNLDEKKIGLLRDFTSVLENITSYTAPNIETALRKFAEDRNIKTRELIHPLRAFTTGTDAGPPLFDTLEVIGKKRCISRIQKIITEKGASNA